MTADKNQAQPIILDVFLFLRAFRRLRFQMQEEVLLRGVETGPPPHGVDGFESRRRDQPWPRIFRDAGLLPEVQCGAKGLLHSILREVEIPKQADQSRQNPSRVCPVQQLERLANLL